MGQERIADRDGSHRADEMLWRDVLEQEARGASLKGGIDVFVEVEGRQDHDPRRRPPAVAGRRWIGRSRRRVASSPSRPGIRMSIRTTSGRWRRVRSDRRLAVGCLGDDLDIRLRLEDHAEPGPDQDLVVGDQDAKVVGRSRHHRSLGVGARLEREPGPDRVPAAEPADPPPTDRRRATLALACRPAPGRSLRPRRWPAHRRGSRRGAGRAPSSSRTRVAAWRA